jgi:hypothetical protein
MHRDGKMTELAAYRVQWEAFHISFSFGTDNTRFTQEKQLNVKFQNSFNSLQPICGYVGCGRVGFVMCGCFENCVGVWVICVFVFTVFCIVSFIYIYSYLLPV